MRTEAPISAITISSPPVSRRFGLNLVSNVGKLGVTLVIGAWYVPFLVRHLGPAAYGLIPLTSTVTSYMVLMTLALNSAIGRYMTIALEKGDGYTANLIFNTSFWGNLVLTAILLIPVALGVLFVDDIFRVPLGMEVQARWLFASTAAAFLLSEIKTPFEVSSYSRNRFDLRNIVAISEVLARVALVVLLFYVLTPAISYVGFAIFFGTVVSSIGAIWVWRRLTPSLRLHLRDFDWNILKDLTKTGGWVIVNQIGALLYVSIDLLIANRLFGAEAGGRYAAVLQLPILIRTLGSTVGVGFSPTMLYHFARQDISGLMIYLARMIKCLGLILALPISLTCGFAEPLLRLWLGPDFSSLHLLLLLMTAHLCINTAMLPLLDLQLVANRVKVPGVVTLVMGLGNLGLALLLAGPMHWGLYGIAAATAIMWVAKNVFFTPIYAGRILGKSSWIFFRELILVALVTLVASLACYGLGHVQPISDWFQLAAEGLVISALYCLVIFFIILTQEERDLVRNFIPFARN